MKHTFEVTYPGTRPMKVTVEAPTREEALAILKQKMPNFVRIQGQSDNYANQRATR